LRCRVLLQVPMIAGVGGCASVSSCDPPINAPARIVGRSPKFECRGTNATCERLGLQSTPVELENRLMARRSKICAWALTIIVCRAFCGDTSIAQERDNKSAPQSGESAAHSDGPPDVRTRGYWPWKWACAPGFIGRGKWPFVKSRDGRKRHCLRSHRAELRQHRRQCSRH
jgi:hypothetical protein